MRLQLATLSLLNLCISALPLPSASSDAANILVNGIQTNLDHGQQEIQSVKTLQSLEANNAAAADITSGIAAVQNALDLAIADRTANQALATAFPDVTAGLAKVQAAQTKATTTVGSLNGIAANDGPLLDGLLTTFTGGFATNQANLVMVSLESVV